MTYKQYRKLNQELVGSEPYSPWTTNFTPAIQHWQYSSVLYVLLSDIAAVRHVPDSSLPVSMFVFPVRINEGKQKLQMCNAVPQLKKKKQQHPAA